MEDQMEDVNQSAEDSQVESSSTEVQQEDPQPSAETLNTENAEQQRVPYDRFKEVNEAKKALEEQLAQYESQKDFIEQSAKFNEILESNPELYQKMKGVMAEYMQGNGQPEEGPQIDPYVQHAISTNQQLIVDQYVSRFQQEAQKAGVPEEMIPFYQGLTEQELLKINQNPLANYRPNDVVKAFKNVHDQLEKFHRTKQNSYVQKKVNDAPPASSTSSTGQIVQKEKVLKTQHDRAQALSEKLKVATRI